MYCDWLMILASTCESREASEKCLTVPLRGQYALTEAASSCTEQIELGRKSDTKKGLEKVWSVFKIKHPVQTKQTKKKQCIPLNHGKSTKI